MQHEEAERQPLSARDRFAVPSLTVRDVLALEPLQAGLPEVVTGHAELDRAVRWVHVTESRSAADFLVGGELVLTTGAGWPPDAELAGHLEAVARAGATGLILELGTRFESVPPVAVRVCEEVGLPLVVLHREVRFVGVTEAAHRLLVESRVAELEVRDEIQALFAELNRLGASPATIVAETSRLLRAPVVLEDISHRVVCCEPHDRTETEVLAGWS